MLSSHFYLSFRFCVLLILSIQCKVLLSQHNEEACPATLSVYPGFEDFNGKIKEMVGSEASIGLQVRQFNMEISLLNYFYSHKCLVPYEDNVAMFGEKHAFIIPIPWCSVRTVSETDKKWFKVARMMMHENVTTRGTYSLFLHKHVILATCTRYDQSLWGNSLRRDVQHMISLRYEGLYGEIRNQGVYYPRSMVVPYSTETPEEITKLKSNLSLTKYSALNSDSKVDVFLHCSLKKNTGIFNIRKHIIDIFTKQDILTTNLGGIEKKIEKHSEAEQKRAFLSTIASMKRSSFCLVPPGYTASTRRLYEAIRYGCIPVILSTNLTLPFQSDEKIVSLWNRSVILHDPDDIESLPATLGNVSGEEMVRKIEAIDALGQVVLLSGSSKDPSSFVWEEIIKMLGFGSSSIMSLSHLLGSKNSGLDEDIINSGQVVVSYFSISEAGVGVKRATSLQSLIIWSNSLRRHFTGPVIILMKGYDAKVESFCLTKNITLISNVELKLANKPPISAILPVFRPSEANNDFYHVHYQGNQLRLLYFSQILHLLHNVAPSAQALVMDIRDVIVQSNPFEAFREVNNCSTVVAVDDCACAAGADKYFKTWGGACLHTVPALTDNPPVNGGIQLGKVGFLAETYNKASVYGVLMRKERVEYCARGGRDQHLLTASIRYYESTADFCVLPNGVDHQVASWNMGVNNKVKGKYKLEDDRQIITSYKGDTIALLHQYDRYPDIMDFVAKHFSEV